MLIHKTVAIRGDSLEFVLSDDTVDSYGDVIDPKGWDLRTFKSNPIALFGHSSSFPIGSWSAVRVEGGKLIGNLTLAARGTSARIDELIGLVEQGILRAVSVGFMPMKSEPMDPKDPYGGTRYLKQELRECSLVSVPANPAALVLAKSLNISSETLSLAFGEQAGVMRRDGTSALGENARKPANLNPEGKLKMKTLAERIKDAQDELNAKRDRLTELAGVEGFDVDAVEALTVEVGIAERSLEALRGVEKKIGVSAAAAAPAAPAVLRRPLGTPQKEASGLDLIVRAVTARGISHFGGQGKSLEKVLEERYPGNEAVALVAKADQTIGTTSVSGWASEVVRTAYSDFVQALQGFSIYPALRDKGIPLNFDGIGTVSIPGRTGTGAGGGFVAEGSPIRVGRITTAAVTLSPKKLGVIVPFSRELAKRSTPAIEALVRQAILEDTGAVLDAAIIDATASSTARPAGLLNGVTAVSSGFGGTDYQAVVADFKALLAPFITANATDGIVVLMNPTQGLNISMMAGPGNTGFGWFADISKRVTFLESTRVPAGRLIAVRASDLVTAQGDTPEFDVSEQATVHMEDTTPLEIVSAAGTVADPTRSLWQTATIGIRMLMDVAWGMRRAGMVQYIDVQW